MLAAQNNPNERYGFTMVSLAGTITGTGAGTVGVVAFGADPTVRGQYALGKFATVTRDALLGTTIAFLLRGLWRVKLVIPVSGANTYQGGISLDEGGALSQNPTRSGNAAIRDFDRYNGQAAGDSGCLNLDATIPVTQAMINGGQGVVRARMTNGANAAPVAGGVDTANAFLDVELVGDLPGN